MSDFILAFPHVHFAAQNSFPSQAFLCHTSCTLITFSIRDDNWGFRISTFNLWSISDDVAEQKGALGGTVLQGVGRYLPLRVAQTVLAVSEL